MNDSTYLLEKANRFMNVADSCIDKEDYKDITAFNVHMALELALNYVVEHLLNNYKQPMYMAYKREFPVQTTHNLSHVCCVLGNYVDFPVYLSFAVMQMTGWCVNSRYSEEFTSTIEESNLRLISGAINRFLGTLGLLTRIKKIDNLLGELGTKGKLAYYKGCLYIAAETREGYKAFTEVVEDNADTLKELYTSSQDDSKFICSFMQNIELTSFKQIVAKLMQYRDYTDEQLEVIREGFKQLHIDSFATFTKLLGGYARKYSITEGEYQLIVGG